MLDPKLSRARQRRLLDASGGACDAIVIGHPRHIYYLSAHLPHWLHSSGLIILKDGTCWLTAANQAVKNDAVDHSEKFEAQWNATLRQEQPAVVAGQMKAFLEQHHVRRVAVDASEVSSQLILSGNFEASSIDSHLDQLRRRKDPDELALIQKAIDCCDAMFDRAGEIVRPGVSELDVFNALHAAGCSEAREPLSTYLGNDFKCGGGGGAPRKDRTAQEGELYVLDLGPCYRGYFADTCRTFAVSEPTPAQEDAADAVQSSFEIIEQSARPGVRCRDLVDAVQQHLTQRAGHCFTHHLGHGIGLQPHEFPHLNVKWDDVLMEGEVFAAEPALYHPSLKSGIRIENNYLVTKQGVRRLNRAPMGLRTFDSESARSEHAPKR